MRPLLTFAGLLLLNLSFVFAQDGSSPSGQVNSSPSQNPSAASQQPGADAGSPVGSAISGTGSSNFLARWLDSAGTLGSSVLFDNGTDLGIGTQNPGARLEIDSPGNGVSFFKIHDSAPNGDALIDLSGDGIAGGSFFVRAQSADGSRQFAVRGDGSVGIGTIAPQRLLEVGVPGVSSNQIRLSGGGPNGIEFMNSDGTPGVNLFFRTGPQYLSIEDGQSGQSFLNILKGNGNVGIGTSTPGQKLDIAGSANVSGDITATHFIGNGSQLTGIVSTATDANTLNGLPSSAFARLSQNNNFIGAVSASSFNASGEALVGNPFGYQIGGTNVLYADAHGTLVGYHAGFSGGGFLSTFIGNSAGYSDTIGMENTFVGDSAGYSNVGLGANPNGSQNTFVGNQSGSTNIAGSGNAFLGYQAGNNSDPNGNFNTFIGERSGDNGTTDTRGSGGSGNTYIGVLSGSNTTGNNNTYIGNSAGVFNRGNSNVYLGTDAGNTGNVSNESNTMRLGNPQLITATYIQGIYGQTVSSASATQVYVDASGKLGFAPSSEKFKDEVHPMGSSTDRLLQLRPVTFLYKPEYDRSDVRTLQYGLIAEEVADVYPEMVVFDKEGKPVSVKYQYLGPMLLNELQKQHATIKEQQQEIKSLQNRLERLEALLDRSSK